MNRPFIYKSAILIFLFTFTTSAFTSSAAFAGEKTLLIHLRTNIKKDDGPPCVAFNLALAGLKAGFKVEMLFDGEAAYNLKIFNADGKTDFERYTVPPDLKELITQQYPSFPMEKVKTYQDFLAVYHTMGALITVNGTWNALTQVEQTIKGKQHIPKIVEPLTLPEMIGHIARAQIYLAY